jgi:hypothetical protein
VARLTLLTRRFPEISAIEQPGKDTGFFEKAVSGLACSRPAHYECVSRYNRCSEWKVS